MFCTRCNSGSQKLLLERLMGPYPPLYAFYFAFYAAFSSSLLVPCLISLLRGSYLLIPQAALRQSRVCSYYRMGRQAMVVQDDLVSFYARVSAFSRLVIHRFV